MEAVRPRAGFAARSATGKAEQDGKTLAWRIPLSVRGNDFTLPDGSMLPLAITFGPGAFVKGRGACFADANESFADQAVRSFGSCEPKA